MLREHSGAVEADLQRFYGIDYRDRWRGVGLTWRRLWTLIKHLPLDSATVRELNGDVSPWQRSEVLTAELFGALTGKPHPALKAEQGRQKAHQRGTSPQRQAALNRARRRAKARERAIAAGEIA